MVDFEDVASDQNFTNPPRPIFELRILTLVESSALLLAISYFVIRSLLNRKDKEPVPLLFIKTIVFLFISNLATLVRALTVYLFDQSYSKRWQQVYISLTFIKNLFLNGAYWIFAYRYLKISLELQQLKLGERSLLLSVIKPINSFIWFLVVFQAATQLTNNPFWLPHLSLTALMIIDFAILLTLVNALLRIWNLGCEI